MIDIVDRLSPLLQVDQIIDNRDNIFLGQRRRRLGDGQAEFRVHAITSHVSEIVAFLIEEQALEQVFRGLKVGRFSGPQLLVNRIQRLLIRPCDILENRIGDDGALANSFVFQEADFLDL